MRIKIVLATALALLPTIASYAQLSITSLYNGYRDGDKLYRIVADTASVGDRGENCVWELPSAQRDNNVFKQTIYLRNDSLTIVEDGFLLHYISTDEELSMRGFQMRDMYCIQDKPLPVLAYPFVYGDSIADTYSRKTTSFGNFTVEENGSCYTVCDGWGVLTDGNETLNDVLRVHHHNTAVSEYDSVDGDSVAHIVSEVTEDKYLWYCSGCRYPVMDTRIVRCMSNGEIDSDTTFTSLYMPELQLSELAYDEANSQLIAQRDSLENSSCQEGNADDTFPIMMSATLLPGQSEISLDYFVTEDTGIIFYACDLAGRLLGHVTHLTLSTGEYHETMVLERRPINGIVMLTMITGDKKQVVKIN
jgi:hypothetical protein